MKDSRLLSDYKENGFLHIKGFYEIQQITKIKKQLIQEIKGRLRTIPASEKLLIDGKLEFIAEAQRNLSEQFNELFEQSPLTGLVNFLLEETSSLFTSEVLFKRKKIGIGYRPHQDAVYFCSKENRGLNSWTPLDKSYSENGGIWYIPGSHLFGELPHVSHGFNDFSCNYNELKSKGYEKLLPKADVGDLLIHDCLMVHGSSPNRSEKRRIAISRFYFPQSNPPEHGKKVINLKKSLLGEEVFKKV
jgi:phytanoyl-CoA hydroxylase